jgi:hypothetical protein
MAHAKNRNVKRVRPAVVQEINFWTGVLMTSAVGVLLMPMMAIPFIFGGPRAVQLQISHKPVRKARVVFQLHI